MLKAGLPVRGTDQHGSGAYGAPRGVRTHKGVDYAAWPGSAILSPVPGSITKIGYPYGDDMSFRYVEVTDALGRQHRFFYLDPIVSIGDTVVVDDELGQVQDLGKRYPGITPHCHYEIKHEGKFLNPEGS